MGRGEDLVLGRHQAAGGQGQHQDDGADDPVPLPAAPGATPRPPHRPSPPVADLRRRFFSSISSASKTSPGPALVPTGANRHHRHRHLGLVGQNGRRTVLWQWLLLSGRVERKGWGSAAHWPTRPVVRPGRAASRRSSTSGAAARDSTSSSGPSAELGGNGTPTRADQRAHRRVRHEGHGAGDRLVEHQGQRVHVGPPSTFFPRPIRGRHSRPCADHRPGGLGAGRFGQGPGHAEVGHVHPALLVEEEVRRLDVAVHQAPGSGHRPDPAPPRRPTGPPASGGTVVEEVAKGAPAEILGDEIRAIGVLTPVEHAAGCGDG